MTRRAISVVSAYDNVPWSRNGLAAHKPLFRVQLCPLLPGGVRNLQQCGSGRSLSVPHVQTNRDKNLIYYTADPYEMELWRKRDLHSQSEGGK